MNSMIRTLKERSTRRLTSARLQQLPLGSAGEDETPYSFAMQKLQAHNLAANLRWGLSWSVGFIVAYSLIALAVFVVAGPPPDYSFAHLILTYVVLGILAGLTIGVLRPLGKTKTGATILGMIIGILVYLGAGVSVEGVRGMRDPGGVIGLLIGGVIIGGLFGRKSWRTAQEENGHRD